MNRPYPRKVHAPIRSKGIQGYKSGWKSEVPCICICALLSSRVSRYIRIAHTSYLSAIKYSGARKTATRSGEAKNNKQRVRTDDLHA